MFEAEKIAEEQRIAAEKAEQERLEVGIECVNVSFEAERIAEKERLEAEQAEMERVEVVVLKGGVCGLTSRKITGVNLRTRMESTLDVEVRMFTSMTCLLKTVTTLWS